MHGQETVAPILTILGLTFLGLTSATTSLAAQSGAAQSPIPGPYMVLQRQQAPMPTFAPQRFSMPMPYWMQNSQPPQPINPPSSQQQAPAQPVVSRTQQQPANSGWATAPLGAAGQSGGALPTPGFFPGYNSAASQPAARQQPPVANYGTNNSFVPMVWGQQGFMPMQAPWQQGQFGQNGWSNNWNNNGSGYGQGYGTGYGQGYTPRNGAQNGARQ